MPTRDLPHVDPEARRGAAYRSYVRLAGSRAVGVFSRGVMWKVDPILMRLSRGRLGMGVALPTALLETTGARTGQPRRNAVIYFHDGDRVTIVASKLGMAQHPSWFHNLRAHPDVRFGGWPFRAEVVEDQRELGRLWRLADRVFPAYANYRQRAGRVGRTIPIVQLTPRESRETGNGTGAAEPPRHGR